MSEKSEPIMKYKKVKNGKVKIRFQPDFAKFKINELSDDMVNLFKKRVYDISGTTRENITVFLNDEKIKENNFTKYVELYYGKDENTVQDKTDNWEIFVSYKPDHNFEHISFVNCINTYIGGTHVKYITDMIVKQVEAIKKENKDLNVKPQMIKDNLCIFINCLIDKPQFSSQTKEELKSKPSNFGSSYNLNEKIIKKLISFGLVEQIINFIKIKEELKIKSKTSGKKVNNIKGIPKLEDANNAGTKLSSQCCLILTEGDSAKTLAMAGRSVIGNDNYGVFPLKGKLLNVREASAKQQLGNEEIININKIMGLQIGKKYSNINDLRYGKILIFTDQDDDGFHIQGLLINYIHTYWPELLKINIDFIVKLSTPVIRASKGKKK